MDMEVECRACNCKMDIWMWKRHERSMVHKRKMQCGLFDVDTVCKVIEGGEKKKKCRNCGSWRVLELYRGENVTCNKCLDKRKSWAEKNPEKVKEMNKNYREGEMKDEIKEKKKVYNQTEIDCEVCGCKVRKNKWYRHVKTKKHILGVDGEKTCEENCGDGVGSN